MQPERWHYVGCYGSSLKRLSLEQRWSWRKTTTSAKRKGLNCNLKRKSLLPSLKKKSGKAKKNGIEESTLAKYTHPWLVTNLKGHSSPVENIEISLSGKLMASCAPDRTVLIWMAKDFSAKEHKQIRVNIEFDYANRVFWSPDNKAFIVSKAEGKEIEVFKLGKKPDGSVGNIQSAIKYNKIHSQKIIGLGIACNGKCVMSCSTDGAMVIWDLKGTVLKQFNVMLDQTYCAKISPCGRYIAAGGEKLHANRYSLKWDDKILQEVSSLDALKGHEKGIFSLDFKFDSSMIVTLSKTGTWRLFDTTGSRVTVPTTGTLDKDLFVDLEAAPIVKLSVDALLVFVGVKQDVKIFSSFSGDLIGSLENVHDGYIQDIALPIDSMHFITCGDKTIRVFNNIVGLQEKIRSTRASLLDKNLTEALKVRLEEDVTRLKKTLLALEAKS